ncbi:hypothetical protein NN3_01110 [Nocardia neocaledoniensis NBRC 108232]|uniref:Uncharacterized protein DUF4192 n=1 Tax=Nocardia neocaledoniensis TaxID=236511 RepID=A0A317NGF8_9NOCA|nr:DUF4192 family protein [Nocardia neocaledoniensis]PWV74401.1 uncharacterized protein DUF4192 [Nocardia neocaledoniensis]GEM29104.1 hypothetical protein NN3_01110 [Nocardia neocaledoniensis NBRC 108232]
MFTRFRDHRSYEFDSVASDQASPVRQLRSIPVAPNSALVDEVLSHLADAVARDRAELAAARSPDRVLDLRRERTVWLLFQISTAQEEPVGAQDLAWAVALLRDRTIRDIMYGLARSEYHGAAEALWLQIAAATHGHDRAEAVTLFAYSAYHHNNTALARTALAAALDADPTHPIAALLANALDDRLPPQKIRALAEAAAVIAADLGIDIT